MEEKLEEKITKIGKELRDARVIVRFGSEGLSEGFTIQIIKDSGERIKLRRIRLKSGDDKEFFKGDRNAAVNLILWISDLFGLDCKVERDKEDILVFQLY